MTKATYIFDMDGLLIDSEPLWQEVEKQVFATVGIQLSTAMCEQTTGLGCEEVVEYWYRRRPWDGRSKVQIHDDIIAAMVASFQRYLPLKPGAVALIKQLAKNHTVGICSASSMVLIETAVAIMGVEQYIAVIHSATADEFSKPHPLPYLNCAKELACEVHTCIVFEDSAPGAIAAKAAGMTVVAVPEGPYSDDKFGFCDQVLTSLEDYEVPC
ncbi:MAG: HAD superfamily hydrolase (TIGR01509 family) [Phenylobacterium sp.]|jgi:HAD superfamily hydrolase (TIGR01509 family)